MSLIIPEEMNKQEITDFINGYTSDNRDRIIFAWNQKHGAEFKDSNFEFRQNVTAAVVAAPDQATINLLQDLFEAEARWSREAWCICDGFAEVGTLILNRGGIESLDHFLAWFSNCFDAYSACHTMKLDPIIVDRLLQEVNRRLIEAPENSDKSRLKIAKDLFEKYKKGNPAQGMFKVNAGTELKGIRVVSKFEIWIDKIKSMLFGRR